METNVDDRQLVMRIDREGLWAMAWSAAGDGTLETLHCGFDTASGADTLRMLEDAVYANRELLLDVDYRRVWCLDGEAPVLALPEDATEDEARVFFGSTYPDALAEPAFWEAGADGKTVIAAALTPDMASFLRRTFYNVVVMPPMVVLARWFLRRETSGNGARVFVNLRGTALDVIAVERGRPLLFNTFAYAAVDDAVYYILAVRAFLGFEGRTDCAVMLSGPSALRDEVGSRLREFVEGVYPTVFPSEIYRAGAGSKDIPFELAITSLCG